MSDASPATMHSTVKNPRGEIFIVDDDLDICFALSAAFNGAGYLTTIFTDATLFVRAARVRIPTCVLLDIFMPGRSGLDILVDMAAQHYPAPVLILSRRGDIPSVVEAIRSGAFDFIEKRLGADAIVERVRDSINLWAADRQHCSEPLSSFPGCDQLTRREREVLSQIAAAASNKEAAKNLGISRRTVEVHRWHIMRKLHAKNTVDLVRIALNA
ncbi:MAG: response regulator [Xanthobacteraceae bacterium]